MADDARAHKMKMHSSLHGMSVHGTFSAKLTAADKQRVSEEKKKSIFLPWNKYYKIWWFTTVLAAVFTVFFETYFIAFRPAGFKPYGSRSSVLEYCLVALFTVDILVNFNLAYYDEKDGSVVYDRKSIAGNYVRGMFWVDFVGIFPFYLIALAIAGQVGKDSHLAQYLAILRITRLVRLHRIRNLFQTLQYNTNISFIWLTITRNFMVALVWSHIAACVMFFIARQYDFGENTFLGSKLDVLALTPLERYVVSMYWSVVTLASVGYGDYSAANVYEQVWSMIYIMINILILAWMLGSITLLIVKGDQKTGIFRDALLVLHKYSILNSFEKVFEKGLRSQLKLEFDHREIADQHILDHFPSSVRNKLRRKLYLRPLLRTQLLKGVRQQFLDAFLAACNVEIFSPGEQILQRGSISSDLYLLVLGKVEFLDRIKNSSSMIDESTEAESEHPDTTVSSIAELEPGAFINEIGFFTETPQLDTVRTVTVCKTLTMARSVYKAITKDHPGIVTLILNNLLEKVQSMTNEIDTPSRVKLTKRIEILNAGSVYDDGEDPSYSSHVKRSINAVRSLASMTAVQDLVHMHMNKIKDDHTLRFLFAASRDDVATISVMCEHGFDPNSADYDSRTALMVASMKGNTPAVKKLLECLANPNLLDMHGSSALLEAARYGHTETMDVLMEFGAQLGMSESQAASTLCQAVFDGDVVLLRRLLQAKINVNASDYDKRTAAHIAAAEGNVAAMKVLVEFGADLTLEDRWHNTIDDEARRSNSGPLLVYLRTLEASKGDDDCSN